MVLGTWYDQGRYGIGMATVEKDKRLSYVTFDGRTIVNTGVLLQDPQVRETIAKLAASARRSKMKVLKTK